MSSDTASTRFVIQHRISKQYWASKNQYRNNYKLFANKVEALKVLAKLNTQWVIRPVNLEDVLYQPRPGSIASQIDFGDPSQHVLICGEIQIGKLEEKQEIMLHVIEHKHPVLILFRNANVDIHQYTKRRKEFNGRKAEAGEPTLPVPYNIMTYRNDLPELFSKPNIIYGLANPDTVAMVNECFEKHPELRHKLIVIMDEADLVTFELDEKKTITETNMASLFEKIYMLISVTATPGSILLLDKESQAFVIPRPANYYGIDQVIHHAIRPVRSNGKYNQYDPWLDAENLQMIVGEIIKEKQATLLIQVSRLRREHKHVIRYLSHRYNHLSSKIVYLEVNEKSVKVYDGTGKTLDPISPKTSSGTKVAAIDAAIQEYGVRKKTPYLIIVSGVLGGRGVSYVSEDYTRHLTHQYISCSDSTHLESAMQSVRLLGKYDDNPTLHLYCDESLYDDLQAMRCHMEEFALLVRAAREGRATMGDVIAFQHEHSYSRDFMARRKRGSENSYAWESSPSGRYYIMDDPEEKRKLLKPKKGSGPGGKSESKYSPLWLLTNINSDRAKRVIAGSKVGGPVDQKPRVVYCNPLSDFTRQGVINHRDNHGFYGLGGRDIGRMENMFNPEPHPYLESVEELYRRHPEYEGEFLLWESNNKIISELVRQGA